MIRRLLLLSLIGTLLASQSAPAQAPYEGYANPYGGYSFDPGDAGIPPMSVDPEWGPGFPAHYWTLTAPQVHRLPAVEPTAPPLEQTELPAADIAEPVPDADVADADVKVVDPKPKPPPKIWQGNFELGLDGSEGNSQRFNFRFGVEAKRKTEDDVLKLDLDYHKNTSHLEETAHRTFLDWRYEWLFEDSPWTWFAHGTVDYDEFKAFDVRVSIDTGLGYQFIDTDKTSLMGRCGGGWSREVGGPDDEYVPEATFGSEFEHQFSPRQKLTATVDYTPDVSDFRDFRLKTKAGWEFLLDEQMNLSLKLSVLDRYDSTPHGAKPNDVDYSVTLLWSF